MVRTMAEIHEDPERIRVTVDVALSQVGTAAQANRIQVLEAELDAAKLQARGWDHDRHTERDRADRAEAELERRTTERDERENARATLERALADAEAKLFRIRRAAWSEKLDGPMENRGRPEAVDVALVGELLDVVAYVRATTGQPE